MNGWVNQIKYDGFFFAREIYWQSVIVVDFYETGPKDARMGRI